MANSKIKQLIDAGYTIVTPTKRLSRYLQRQFNVAQAAAGLSTWETPDILPWSAWVTSTWETLIRKQNKPPLLLNQHQQQWVWQQIIEQNEEHLLPSSVITAQACEAWHLSCQWRLEIFPPEVRLNQDACCFRTWAKAYQARCRQENWVDAACLEQKLSQIIQAAPIKFTLHLLGFDQLTPAQRLLLEVLEATGSEVRQQPTTDVTGEISTIRFHHSRDEIVAVAHWLHRQLALLQQSGRNADASIGVVVPELSRRRAELENTFDEVLLADNIFAKPSSIRRPYNISLGRPLIDYPMINLAFLILNLGRLAKLSALGRLLRSPFLRGAETEMTARAELDIYLRRSFGEPEIDLNQLQKYLSNTNFEARQCPLFIRSLRQWHSRFHNLPKTQTAAAWSNSFSELLSALGWPDKRNLDGEERQTMVAWNKLLAQFTTLELVAGTMGHTTALAQLKQLARQQIFQPETAEVPIQVMGVLETAGLQFDSLWVLGLHEEIWPAPANANPFLPVKLQQQKAMPHASAQVELKYARRLTTRLASSARQVIFSAPQYEADRALRPSPLINQYKQVPPPAINPELDIAEQIFNSRRLETLADEQAPALASVSDWPELTEPPAQLSARRGYGGTNLFKDQAACPFRAFAKHRLGAQSLPELEPGLNAMVRGQLVHDCLKNFWTEIHSKKQLIEMAPASLNTTIRRSIDKVIAQYTKQNARIVKEKFIALEQERLQMLLQEWLALERERPDFKVVACEQKQTFTLAELSINARIDRIDQLAEGGMVVIDYKTGKAEIKDWQGERPEEPQLPLYASNHEGPIVAIVFAQLKRGEMRFKGVGVDKQLVPGLADLSSSRYAKTIPNWPALLDDWRTNLIALAEEFLKGEARVAPLRGEQTCRNCELSTLCRIHELTTIEPA